MSNSSNMKAAILTEYGKPLEISEVPIPRPGPGELLVKLEACGVCHTDVHFWKGEHELPGPLPQIMGHEGVGRIVEIGNECSDWSVGDRVGVGYVFDTCGSCRECLTGFETNCRNVTCTGVHVNGCFAEYTVIQSNWATRIPDALVSSETAPLLCAGVAAYSAIRKANLEPGELAVIFGAGGLGVYAIQYAKLNGAKVAVVDIDNNKLELARQLGADHIFRADDDPVDKITDIGGADACLNFAPVASTWQQMLSCCSPRGRIVLIALPTDPLCFEAPQIIESGLNVTGSADGSRQELRQLMELANSGKVESIVETLPFHEINTALQRLDSGALKSRLVLEF